MNTEKDLTRISLQEEKLQFTKFDAGTAWEIGSALRQAAIKESKSVAIDIALAGAPLFYCALPGATPCNADWIRRKKNVVQCFHKSSYAVALEVRGRDSSLQKEMGVPLSDYATAGGCFPIRFSGSDALVGTITVSGLPEREDHELVVRTLALHLKLDPESLALQP